MIGWSLEWRRSHRPHVSFPSWHRRRRKKLCLLRPRLSPRPWRPRRLFWKEYTARRRRKSGLVQPSVGPRLCVWRGSLNTPGRARLVVTSKPQSDIDSSEASIRLLMLASVTWWTRFPPMTIVVQMMVIAIKAWSAVISLLCILMHPYLTR